MKEKEIRKDKETLEVNEIVDSGKEEWGINFKVSYIIPWVTIIYFTYVLTYHNLFYTSYVL